MTTRPYDVVVFGATSFVGQILTRYLFEEFGLDGKLRWAAAGRSLPKLEEVRRSLGQGAHKLTLLQADAGDEASLRKLCRSARVVVSTVGPYALYGEPLVRVVRRNRHRLLRPHRRGAVDAAHDPQVRKVCADFGRAHRAQLRVRFDPLRPWRALPAAAGAGTVRPALHHRKDARPRHAWQLLWRHRGLSAERAAGGQGESGVAQRARRSLFALPPGQRPASPAEEPGFRRIRPRLRRMDRTVRHERHQYARGAPDQRPAARCLRHGFPVRRGRADGARLTGSPRPPRRRAPASAPSWSPVRSAPCAHCSRSSCCRRRARARVLQRNSRAASTCVSTAARNGTKSSVRASRATGTLATGSTAKMLGQAAACLASDISKKQVAGGFWTPATAFGDRIIERLQAHSGLTFEVLDK